MPVSIRCRELGMDCWFEAEGETAEAVIESLIRHACAEHDDGWFEIEEIYEAARAVLRERAA